MAGTGDNAEVRGVVAALHAKLTHAKDGLTAAAVGNALYGLRGLRDCAEVRAMLLALAPKVRLRDQQE